MLEEVSSIKQMMFIIKETRIADRIYIEGQINETDVEIRDRILE